MPFPYVRESMQAAVLSAISGVLAQGVTAYVDNRIFALDTTPIILFVTYAILNTPINCAWQEWLEATFPGSPKPHDNKSHADKDNTTREKTIETRSEKQQKKPTPKLNVTNTLIKFGLDQTIGATYNTIAFVAGMGALKGLSWDEIVHAVQNDAIYIYLAGLKLWPAVSLLNFSIIPVDKRMLFGSLAGLVWGIFLSLQGSK